MHGQSSVTRSVDADTTDNCQTTARRRNGAPDPNQRVRRAEPSNRCSFAFGAALNWSSSSTRCDVCVRNASRRGASSTATAAAITCSLTNARRRGAVFRAMRSIRRIGAELSTMSAFVAHGETRSPGSARSLCARSAILSICAVRAVRIPAVGHVAERSGDAYIAISTTCACAHS